MQRCHQAGAGCALALLLADVYLAPGAAPSDGGNYKQQQKRRMSKDLGLRPLVVVVVAEAAVQSSLLRPVQPCLHQLCNTRLGFPASGVISSSTNHFVIRMRLLGSGFGMTEHSTSLLNLELYSSTREGVT